MSSTECRTAIVVVLLVLGCGSSNNNAPGSSNAGGSGSASGGATASGGNVASGGSTANSSSISTGGLLATGGAVATGGVTSSVGSSTKSSTGGAVATGGVTSSVGSSTKSSTGGAVATGGSSSGIGGAVNGGTTSATGGKSGGQGGASTGGIGKGGASAGGSVSTGGHVATGGAAAGGATGSSTGGQATAGSSGTSADPVKSDGCGKTPSLKTGTGLSISVSGSSRTYNLKVPDPYDNSKAYRLIMSYHWLGGSANDVTNGGLVKPYYGLWDLAGGSTIFVAPQGLSGSLGVGWENKGGADVEFSRQLITLMESEFCIDKSRIFCEGFSMGGSMSYAMACAMGDTIRGVAVHSGGAMSGCVAHTKPVAYFMTHGTDDTTCTWGTTYGAPQLQDFAKLDGCKTPDPTLSASAFLATLPKPTSTASDCVDFTGCQADYPVRSCLFKGPHTPSPDGTNGWVPKESWTFISQF